MKSLGSTSFSSAQRIARARSHRRSWLGLGWTLLGLGMAFALATPPASRAATAAAVPREYDIKAAFLFNFASFIEWPAQAFSSPTAPFVIGVIGDDPFGAILDEIVAGEVVKGHPLAVRRLTSRQISEAAACHILFISSSEARRLRPILQQVRGKPVFTVSDVAGFIDAGGAVAFSTDGSVRLSINPVVAQAANLTISSKLLRLAHVVEKVVTP